jgi:glycine hydroxymethyltransferase
MLLKVEAGKDGPEATLKNMHIPHFPEMGLFQTAVEFPTTKHDTGKVIVTYNPPTPQDISDPKPREPKYLEIPLRPMLVKGKKKLQVMMHKSPTTGYDMGAEYNDWFSECFGFPVILAYLGNNSRKVLGTMAPEKRNKTPWWTIWYEAVAHVWRRIVPLLLIWLFILIRAINIPIGMMADDDLTPQVALPAAALIFTSWVWGTHCLLVRIHQTRISFADCAPFLVISQASIDDVSARLPEGEEMDHTKFRPNIVVSGADSAFEEDFWTELVVGPTKARLLLTGNCVRCQSLNVDYETGSMAEGETGMVLKKLMKDRRVDRGAKFSPVFGRYSFLHWTGHGDIIRVGDEVGVVARSNERTVTGMESDFFAVWVYFADFLQIGLVSPISTGTLRIRKSTFKIGPIYNQT